MDDNPFPNVPLPPPPIQVPDNFFLSSSSSPTPTTSSPSPTPSTAFRYRGRAAVAVTEMAAAAYDVAALALKGPDTPLNFPNSILSYPIPASLSATDIRAAAAAAAQARIVRAPQESGQAVNPHIGQELERREEYYDEDELLNMPNLLDEMARGMQVSPPRISSFSSDDSPGNSDGDNLWSYTL
ncbi:hypothetical protein ACSQ67_014051 [Phaseolus vulgaris]